MEQIGLHRFCLVALSLLLFNFGPAIQSAKSAEEPSGRSASPAPENEKSRLIKEAADLGSGKSILTVEQIVDEANKVLRGESSHANLEMTIVTPNWSRDLQIEAWNRGRTQALILIHAPLKDKGNTTLRRGNEMWLWMPKVDRVVKVPPTMMHSSWQGSDFTYEDIIKADSIVKDYRHSELEREKGDGYVTLKIHCDPKPDAPVVWGKIFLWCRVYPDGGVVPVREEDYSERGELVRTITLSEIETVQGRRIPTLLECKPERKPGQKTSIKYHKIDFDVALSDNFFSLSRLQRTRE